MLSMYYKKIYRDTVEDNDTMDEEQNIFESFKIKFNSISSNKKLNANEKYEILSMVMTLKKKHRNKTLTEKDLDLLSNVLSQL